MLSDSMASIWTGSRQTSSGVDVTESSALRFSAVFACIKILSESSSMLPLKLYRRTASGKSPDPAHPLYRLLHSSPNPEMTSMGFRQTLGGHLTSWGNAYAEIEWDKAGRPIALWPLPPNATVPFRSNAKKLFYEVTTPSGEPRILGADEVLHLRGLSRDGITGYSPIGLAREAIGLGLAAEEFGSRFFGNGALPGFLLKHPGILGEEGRKNLRDSWNEEHQGLSRSHRLGILEEGMGVEKIGIPPEDAQFIELRQFQVRDIARIYRVPLHMLADLEKGASFASVEQMSLEFVMYTLMPWLVCWEQEISRSLLLPSEQEIWFAEHLVSGLMRGDMKSRYDAYAIGRQWGWLSADDIRELENMNPLPDGQGKSYLVPLNMASAGTPNQPQNTQKPAPTAQ